MPWPSISLWQGSQVPQFQSLEVAVLLVVGLLAVDADILELVKLGVSLFAEEHLVFLGDGIARDAEEVHAGHAVVAHGGVQRVVERLGVHGHAFDLVLDEPSAGVNARAGRVMIVRLGVVKQLVHARVEADDHAFELFRLDADLLAGRVEVLARDQAPRLDVDWQADGVARVGVDRHLVRVAGAAAVKLVLHDVTRRVAVGARVHRDGDLLREDAALGHRVGVVDKRLVEIRPARNLSTKRMRQVNKNLFSHCAFSFS